LDRYKTWLVAKRYTQTYEDTFASMTNMNIVKFILTLVTHLVGNYNSSIKKMPFCMSIEEKVYMKIPHNF